MKTILFTLFLLVAISYSAHTQTNYGYVPRNLGSRDYSETTLQITIEKREISISLDGQLHSYTTLLGDEIKRDYRNLVVMIGDLEIKYDYNKRVEKIGTVEFRYSSGKMISMGNYEVLYDYDGKFKGTKEKSTPYHSW